MRDEHASEESENDRCSRQPAKYRDAYGKQERKSRIAREQIPGAAKPGEKCCDGHEIERRHMRAMAAEMHCVASARMHVRVKVRKMHMPSRSPGNGRHHTENQSDYETDEIE